MSKKKQLNMKIVVVVVLAMLLQVVAPVAQTVYAELVEKAFTFEVDTTTGRYEWTYNPEKADGQREFTIDLKLKLTQDFPADLIDNETKEVVGKFIISKEGILTAEIFGKVAEEPEVEVEDEVEVEVEELLISDVLAKFDEDNKLIISAKVTGTLEDQRAKVEILNEEQEIVDIEEEIEIEDEILEVEFENLEPGKYYAKITIGQVEKTSEEFEVVEVVDKTPEENEPIVEEELDNIEIEFVENKIIVQLEVEGFEGENALVQIFTEDSKKVAETEVEVKANLVFAEYEDLEPGQYLVKITIGEEFEVSKKFLVEDSKIFEEDEEPIVEEDMPKENQDIIEPEEDEGAEVAEDTKDEEVSSEEESFEDTSFIGRTVARLAVLGNSLEELFLPQEDTGEDGDKYPSEPISGEGTIEPNLFLPANILSGEEETPNDKFKLTFNEVTDLSGKEYDDNYKLKPDDEFFFSLNWELENGHSYVEGSVYEFNLPEQITLPEAVTNFELKDEHGGVAATLDIDKLGNAKITFTDYVKNSSNVSGYFNILVELDKNNTEVDEAGNIVITPINEGDEIKIPLNLGGIEKSISKEGTPNKKYEGTEIKWEITINPESIPLKGAIIEDLLPIGTEYKPETIKVYKQKTSLDGIAKGERVDVTLETGKFTVVDSTFKVDLGDINEQYTIEYTTIIKDEDDTEFVNNAKFITTDQPDVNAQATVNITRGEPLKKTAVNGFNPKTGIIEWEIEFNYNQKSLVDETLTDAWTLNQSNREMNFVEGSLEIIEMVIDENGAATDTSNTPDIDSSKFSVTEENGKEVGFTITDITTSKPYKIKYQTKVEGRVIETLNITNTAGFGDINVEGTGLGSLGQYYGSKSAGNVDYKNKTIDWTIELNHDEYEMKNISIKDILGKGLTLTEDGFTVTVGGTPYTGHTIIKNGEANWPSDGGDASFIIKFPEEYLTKEKIVITYKTKFDADKVPKGEPTNTAEITWTPKDSQVPRTENVTASTELNKETQDYSWKSGKYDPNKKEITWTIIANYRENTIENLIIEDSPQGNQKLVTDSVKYVKLKVNEDGSINEEGGYTYVTVTENSTTFTATIGKTSNAYKLEYKTSLAELTEIQKEYTNIATIKDDKETLSENITAKVGVYGEHKYGNKTGSRDGKFINWSIGVNIAQEKATNLKLEDTISKNQEYLEHTIKVYKGKFDEDGKLVKDGGPLSSGYTLNMIPSTEDDGDKFTISWSETVEKAFIVEYSTIFYDLEFENGNASVTNSYKITGDNITEISGDSSGSGGVTIKQTAMGGATGQSGRLIVKKLDTSYTFNGTGYVKKPEGTPLEDVEFKLYDYDSKSLIKIGKTDSNGKLDFGRLLFGTYELVETLPSEYVSKSEKQIVTINKKYTNDEEEHTVTIENYKPVYAVELTKVDSVDSSVKLQGAEFEIFKDNVSKGKETTNKNGYLIFNNLDEAGTYKIKEVTAPIDYDVSEKEYTVTIGAKEQKPIDLGNITNTLKPGQAELTKMDKEVVANGLSGAEFEVYKYDTTEKKKIGNPIATVYSKVNGVVNTGNLPPEDYIIFETKAPNGFEVSQYAKETGYPFKIKIESQRGSEEIVKIDTRESSESATSNIVTNEVKTTNIQLTKQDSINKSQKLQGVKFKITNYSGQYTTYYEGSIIKEVTTNNDGIAEFTGLKPGTYTIIEDTVPSDYGYIKGAGSFDVIVTLDNVDKGTTVKKDVENKPLAHIILHKEDSETGFKLANAVFTVKKDNAVIGTYTTDNAGKISITGLSPGDYTIEETTPPTGYDILQTPKVGTFSVVAGVTDTKVIEFIEGTDKKGAFKNDIKLGSVKLTKKDGDDDTSLLAGVKFKLEATELYNVPASNTTFLNSYNDSLNTRLITENSIIESNPDWNTVTDTNGEITVINLRPGKYKFTEMETLVGYQPYASTDSYNTLIFEIDVEDNQEQKVLDDVKNYQLVDISVEKVWEDTGYERPIEVSIELLRRVGSSGDFSSFTQDGINTTATLKVDETDNANSWKHTFNGLNAVDNIGQKYTYTVVEKNMPIGYDVSYAPSAGITGANANNKITVTNKAKTASIKVIKTDEISKVKLSGAKYQLIYPTGASEPTDGATFIDGVYSGRYYVEKTTEANGELTFDNLQPGEYILIETDAPDGYYLDDKSINITVSYDNVASPTVLEQKLTNKPYAEITLTKVDSETEIPLSGAEFTVYKKDTNDNVKTVTTGADGKISITGLPAGDYILKETKAPTGYNLPNEEANSIVFTVRSDGSITDSIGKGNIKNDIIKGSVKLKKVSGNEKVDGNDKLLAGVEFKIQATSLDKVPEDKKDSFLSNYNIELAEGTYKTDSNGELIISNLRPGTYTINEVYPEGYQKYSNLPSTFTIGLGQTTVKDLATITNYKLKTIAVEKVWAKDTEANRPAEVTIELLRKISSDTGYSPFGENGSTKIELNSANGWKHTFTGLDVVDGTGNAYLYTVEEVGASPEYEVAITETAETGFTITNTRRTYAIGDYVWIDDESNGITDKDGIQNETKPLEDVIVELYYADEKPVLDENGNHMTTTTDENGRYIFDELPSGKYKIKFILTEEQAEKYEFTQKNQGSGDDKDKLDSDADPETGWTKEITLDSTNTNLTKVYDAQAVKASEGIDPTWDAGVILREKINISGSKTWADNNNQDGKRPNSITINLLQGADVIATKEVRSENGWEWEFENLNKFKPGTTEVINYTIAEVQIPNYSATINGYNVTNSYTPGKTSVQVTKAWEDFGNRSGERPASIMVKLFENGADTNKTLELTPDNWTGTFRELDEYKSGTKIQYTVKELTTVTGYLDPVVTGDMENGFVITNTKKTYAIGDYTWIDTNKDGIQDGNEEVLPGVIVILYDKDGKTEIARTTTDKDGLYIFDELESGKYFVRFELTEEQQKLYEFTSQNSGSDTKIDSDAHHITGWTKEITLDSTNTNLTQSYTDQPVKASEGIDPTWDAGVVLREKTEIKVNKEWVNGPKPAINLQLLRNNEAHGDIITLNGREVNAWEYFWKDLYKTDLQKNPYTYTVKELAVDNYESTITGDQVDGFTITNTYQIPKISITATKVWSGGSGTRPTIELQLYRDGEAYDEPVKLENGTTEYTWEDLDATDIDGNKYEYTVDEVNVPTGYRKSVSPDGLTITNTYRTPVDPSEPGPGPGGGGGGGGGGTPPPTDPKDPPKEEKPKEEPKDPEEPEKPVEEIPEEPEEETPVDPEEPTEPTEPPIIPPEELPELPPTETPREEKDETPEDTPKIIELDPGDTPKGIGTPPTNGKVTIDKDGNWTYTPNPGFVGKDRFSIVVIHPDGTEEEIFFDIDVTPPMGGTDVETLPKTGETVPYAFYLLGLALIAFGLSLRKRKTV